MCNEREDSVWYINSGDVSGSSCKSGDAGIALNCNDSACWTSTITCTHSMYTKADHADGGIGLNRKFEPTLVDDIDKVYNDKWNLPEYIPFRECIKMGIQDGIVAGKKVASDFYGKLLADKVKEVEDASQEIMHWKNAFKGLLIKCREGVEAFEFISKVVHLDNQWKAKVVHLDNQSKDK